MVLNKIINLSCSCIYKVYHISGLRRMDEISKLYCLILLKLTVTWILFTPKTMFVSSPSHYHQYHQSISTSIFSDQFKNCSVHPYLKKPNFDKENLTNYHPISHLSYLSKTHSLKELSKHVSLNIYIITISSTLFSQLTSKVIPLKLLYCLSMTTSSKL